MRRAKDVIMLHISWKIRKTAQNVREQTDVRDTLKAISKLEWQWEDHIEWIADNL